MNCNSIPDIDGSLQTDLHYRVWKDVSDAIYVDHMPGADVAKRIVEDAQRNRRTECLNYQPRCFELDVNIKFWEFRRDNLESYFKRVLMIQSNINLCGI